VAPSIGGHIGKVYPWLTFFQIFMTFGSLEAEISRSKWQYLFSIGRKMSFEQRANIKFCFKLGKTFIETF